MAGVKIAAAQNGGSAEIAGPPSSSANTVLKLPADTGSAGQVLKVKSANHSATNAELEWAADAGGKVLGVATAFFAETQRTITSTDPTWVDTGIEVSYTPVASNSTALITVSTVALMNSGNYLYLAIRQDDGILGGGSSDTEFMGPTMGNVYAWMNCSFTAHITPTWTAGTQTSFQLYVCRYSSGSNLYLGWGDEGTLGNSADWITIQEIAA